MIEQKGRVTQVIEQKGRVTQVIEQKGRVTQVIERRTRHTSDRAEIQAGPTPDISEAMEAHPH